MNILRYLFLVLSLFIYYSSAEYNPCNGQSQSGGECRVSDDCIGVGVMCLRGVCRCHSSYKQVTKTDSNGNSYKECEKLPDVIGGACSSAGNCAEPLICIDKLCQCNRGSVKLDANGECYDQRNIGDTCASHNECRQPMQACISGRCGCIEGSAVNPTTGKCTAAQQCPFGTKVGKPCRRFTNIRSDFENVLNNKAAPFATDNCADGQFCYTSSGDTFTGFCCEATCPLNTVPVSSHCGTCTADTQFCHRVSGNTFAFAVCCQRPCSEKEFNNTYVNQRCMPASALNDRCETNNQCDGLASMMCDQSSGRCKCRSTADGPSSYTPRDDALTQSTLNPPQSCRNSGCAKELSRTNLCYKKVSLGEECFVQEQCPASSGCYRGICTCRCGYQPSGTQACVIKPTTTQKPSATTTQFNLAGLIGGGGATGTGGTGTSGANGIANILGGLSKGGGLFGGLGG